MFENEFNVLTNESEKISDTQEILERQQLFRDIMFEVDFVEILSTDMDTEGNLLAPNGEKSNLPEIEWKITRTPSFAEFFGEWDLPGAKEKYKLWLKYKELEDLEEREKYLAQFDSTDVEKNLRNCKEEIAVLKEYLAGAGFDAEQIDYSKVLDENGEPLLLCRSIDIPLDEDGNFTLREKEIRGEKHSVGIFLGQYEEAKWHNKKQARSLYKTFVNCRDFKILTGKLSWWDEIERVQKIKEKHEGMWVKEPGKEEKPIVNEEGVNLIDFVCFDPKQILVLDIE
jgi:hypothetical protein